jgi:excisionase family DNA binding protein
MYTVIETANRLRLSRAKLYYLVGQRRIGHYRIDGKILFREADIEAFLAKKHVEPATPAATVAAPKAKHLSLEG